MALPITITDAGRAEMINAQNTGTQKVTIVSVAFGTGRYTPSKGQTALQAEVKRVSSIAGAAVADDTIHVVAMDESSSAYNVGEFGLISATGTLVAVYSQLSAAGWILQKAAASTLLLATDIILESLDATTIEFGDISFINPPATTEVPGVVELATAEETIDGMSATRAITPLALKQLTASLERAGLVRLNNTLTSTSTSQALTAAQGKKLQDEKLATDRVQSGSEDNIAGQLLTVGAFGLGAAVAGSINASSDITSLDNITLTGFRRVLTADVAAVNGPAGAAGGVVLTIAFASTNVFQLYSNVASAARTWMRYRNASTWSAWVEQYTTSNLSPVETSRQITAGNGLTGGGTLDADRALSLGTPGTVSTSSSNSVSSTSHTHDLDIPDASTTEPGLVRLNNTLVSTSTSQALTAAQGKKLQDEKLGTDRVQSSATDNAAGKLLTAGAFGLGNSASIDLPGGNANTLDVSGVYRCASSTVGMPFASLWQLQHWQQAANVAVQIAQRAGSSTNELFVRTRNTSEAWSNWAQLYSTDNLPTQANAEDNSAGKLLQVGAFGLGASAVSSASAQSDVTSLDDITVTGFRRVLTADVAAVNGPSGAGGGAVLTIAYSATNLYQLYGNITSSARTWTRYRTSSGWSAWVEQYNSGNLSPVETSRQVTAGNGLTGGGSMAADRSLALGTPGTLSGSTSNGVSSTSHTHAISAASLSVQGVVELATAAELAAGESTRAATGAAILAGILGGGNSSHVVIPYRDGSGNRAEMIFQWTTTGAVSNSMTPTPVTFPVAFPNACLGVIPGDAGSSLATIKSWKVLSDTISKNGASIMFANDSGSGDGYGRIFAWGN